MTDLWTDRLSEYLDGTLGAADRAALEAHLGSCAACREALDGLRRVVARAQALEDRPPAADLWPAVAARIGVARAPGAPRGATRPRVSFTVPQLAAASLALALLSGGTAWLAGRRSPVRPAAAGGGAGAGAVSGAAPPVMVSVESARSPAGDARYGAAVADLERTLRQNRGRLDTATVRIIEKNLAIIDRAIRDAQSALAGDPANAYLHLHLADEMRRKLELLRQAAALTGTRT